MSDVTVTAKNSGPYLVAGPMKLLDADGNAYAVDRDVIASCRCGHSATKPFCDGSHEAQGFIAEERASETSATVRAFVSGRRPRYNRFAP